MTTIQKIINSAPYVFMFLLSGGILSASAMSFFELNTAILPLLFFIFGFVSILFIIFLDFNFPKLDKRESIICLLLALLLSATRLMYMLEPALTLSFNAVCWDDLWHIQELSSLIYSEEYPPKSTFIKSNFLSFYYAPWVAGAALFKLGILATIKQAYFIICTLYSIVFSYSAFAAGKVLYPSFLGAQRALTVLIIFFGGFDFFFGITNLALNIYNSSFDFAIPHAEWWMDYFGFKVQFPNFFTMALWVPHHLSSALAILFGVYILNEKQGKLVIFLAGVCFSYALFASVFVVVGSIPLLFYIFLIEKKLRVQFILAFFWSMILSLPLFWMYMDRGGENGFSIFGALSQFWLENIIFAFIFYMFLLLLEFFPIFLAIYLHKRLENKALLILSTSYLFSTFFFAYGGSNNFAMRGCILPVATLFYIVAPQLYKLYTTEKKLIIILLIPFFIGGVWEYFSFAAGAIRSAYHSNTYFNRVAYESNVNHGLPPSSSLISNDSSNQYEWYLLENIKIENKANLIPPDVEIINHDNKYRLTFQKLINW